MGSPSWDDLELLQGLAPGDKIEAHEPHTGHLWRGAIDIVIPEQGKLWIYAELGERKLIDTQVHTVSKND